MSLRIKHVSGYSLFVGDPDALKPQPVPVRRQPQWPNAVAISLPAGILTFKYSPQVSYRKHRHAASQGSTLTGNGAEITTAGMAVLP